MAATNHVDPMIGKCIAVLVESMVIVGLLARSVHIDTILDPAIEL
jgi:hypothetical protein